MSLFISLVATDASGRSNPTATVIVVVGAPGTAEYGQEFRQWSNRWQQAAAKGNARFICVGDQSLSKPQRENIGNEKPSYRDQLYQMLKDQSADAVSTLWLVLVGHGTFDGHTAKFNLQGPDLSADDLAGWLTPLERPVVVINCASASAPFINKLSAPGRVVITATKSGHEQNFARYGKFLSATVTDITADLDKDGQVSLLEAHLTACRQTSEFYEQEARLMTEHALVDDNGDGLGTPAEWFRGIRAIQQAKGGTALDGTRAHQLHLVASDREAQMPPEVRERRNKLELDLTELRARKQSLSRDEYFARLERLLVELARLYDSAQASKADGPEH